MIFNTVKLPRNTVFPASRFLTGFSPSALCRVGKPADNPRVCSTPLRTVNNQATVGAGLTFRALALLSCLLLLLSVPTISLADARININSANADDLSSVVNGIGPAKAAAIVAYRDMHGEFKTLEEILNVPGIGEVTLSRIKPYLALQDSSTTVSSNGDKTDRN